MEVSHVRVGILSSQHESQSTFFNFVPHQLCQKHKPALFFFFLRTTLKDIKRYILYSYALLNCTLRIRTQNFLFNILDKKS